MPARALSLPAVTFRAEGRAMDRARASTHLRCPQWKMPGPRAAQQARSTCTWKPHAPRAQHRPAKRSRRCRHVGPL